jgi:hypothetical protein
MVLGHMALVQRVLDVQLGQLHVEIMAIAATAEKYNFVNKLEEELV